MISTRFSPAHPRGVTLREIQDRFGLALAEDGAEVSAPDGAAEGAAERRDAALATTILSVASDNRRASDGDLFAALPGARAHGAQFARAALDAGARAVLTDPDGVRWLREHGGVEVPILIAPAMRQILGPVAAFVHGSPATALRTFAITGTNGKTTTTFLLDHILTACGARTGLIGTVETRSAGTVVPSVLTTPEAPELQEWLARMVEDRVDALTMEVSSHSLSMHRVDALTFDVVGFTNLSQDHLDFHGDLESYFQTKCALFTPDHGRRGVAIVDTAWGRRLTAGARIPVATLLTDPSRQDADVDWRVQDVEATPERTLFTVIHRDGRSLRTSIMLPGAFNISNAALALVMAIEGGLEIPEILAGLGSVGIAALVPGRMEVLSTAPRVVVDFAHNADALALALDALRATTAGRLIVVFGATGERDTGKRPIMGRVAGAGADVVIVTDDDPHGEDPVQIRAEVLGGLGDSGVEVLEIAPRADAIREAVLLAGPGDTVLIAGRGHETIQEVAGEDLALDDREEARSALAGRRADGDG